jgi:hypothetical protein
MLEPPKPSASATEEFKHGAGSVLLTKRQHAIATKLRAAMGKGHISAQFLAETVLGALRSNAAGNEFMLREIVDAMNPQLARLGLKAEFFKNYGFLMKELPRG